jgi:GNAT superfamily N-acetyltransferase
MEISKTKLSPQNEKQVKALFKECWPGLLWRTNVPFIDDDLYLVHQDGKFVAFCMVHNSPPRPTTEDEKGSYFYNLAVSPKCRRQGIATKLIDYLTKEHKKCYMDMEQGHPQLGWIERHGWVKMAESTHNLVNYSFGFPPPKEILKIQSSEHYDADENVIYL